MTFTNAEAQARYKARHPDVVRAIDARYTQTPGGRAVRRRANREWKRRNVPFVRNHNRILQRVRYHVSVGHLVRTPCGVCGELKVQAHHYLGYDRAHELDVEWLCARHHREAHEAHPELTVPKAAG